MVASLHAAPESLGPVVLHHPRRFRVLSRLFRDRAALIAILALVLVVLVAVVGPWVARHQPNEQVLTDRIQGPSGEHWLGTDRLGRDLFARLASGARISLAASALAVGVGLALGVPAGIIAGYGRRRIDALLTAVSDTALSIPPLLLAMVIVGIRGPGMVNAMIAVGVILAPRFYRVTRAQTRLVREETFVEASRAVGCPPVRLLWRHLLPNVSGPIVVQISFALGVAIVAEASLSFLGLGVQPPASSWGSMTQDAYQSIRNSTWQLYPPAVIMTITVLAMSVLGDGLRDALGREQAAK